MHGFGYDITENSSFQNKLAESLNAELLSLNGPFPSGRDRGGFAWYEVTKRTPEKPKTHILDNKFLISEKYIREQVEGKMKELDILWNNVIFCGRSQGAFLSIVMGLKSIPSCRCIISISGFFYKDIPGFEIKSHPKLIWIKTKHDTVLQEEKKQSYKTLEKLGVKVDYFLDKNSDHDILEDSIIDRIKENI